MSSYKERSEEEVKPECFLCLVVSEWKVMERYGGTKSMRSVELTGGNLARPLHSDSSLCPFLLRDRMLISSSIEMASLT